MMQKAMRHARMPSQANTNVRSFRPPGGAEIPKMKWNPRNILARKWIMALPRRCETMGGSSVRHRADFFFDFRDIDHDDGVPRTAIKEAAIGALAKALLAADAENRVNLDAAKRRTVLIRHPEHAVLDRAVLHAGRRAGAAGAAFGDDGEFLRLLL